MCFQRAVGYGDIHPTTFSECVCAIGGMVVGGFVFGTVVGNLSEVSRRANPGKSMQSKKTGAMRAFLTDRGISGLLSRRITTWCGSAQRPCFLRCIEEPD